VRGSGLDHRSQERRRKGRDQTGKKAAAEFIGTFWLVLGGCGSAVLAGYVYPAFAERS
jgi:hypothetical protein